MRIEIRRRLLNTALLFSIEAPSWREALEMAVNQGADLRDADLRGLNLGDINLRGAILGGADLRGSNLEDINLRGADLANVDLRNVNLRNADLGDVNLRGSNLGDVNLRGVDLGNADLRDVNLRGADLGGDVNLGGVNLRGADLGNVDLEGVNLQGANLQGVKLQGAKLQGATVLAVAPVGDIDGWPTTLWRTDQGYRIQAGCHWFTLQEAEKHYANRETRQGLYYLATEAWRVIARLQGWTEENALDVLRADFTARATRYAQQAGM